MISSVDYLIYGFIIVITLSQFIPSKDTKNKSDLLFLKAALFLFFLSTEFSRSFFPIFASSFDVAYLEKPIQMGLPQIVWGLSALIATPYGYKLSKKVGTPRVLIGAASLTALATIMMGASSNYWIMLLCRSLIASAYGTIAIVGTIYLSNQGKASTTAILLTAIAAASITGNASGSLTAQISNHNTAILISSIFAIGSSILLIAFFRPNEPSENQKIEPPTIKGILINKRIQAFALLNTIPFRLILTGFVLYLIPVLLTKNHISTKIIGQMMMLYFLVNWLLTQPLARLLDKHESYTLSAISSPALMAIGLILFHYSNDDIYLIATSICILSTGMTLNSVIQTPIIPVIFQKECLEHGKDTINTYFRTIERIGSVLGPLAASLLLSFSGFDLVLWMGVSLLLICFGLFLFFGIDKQLSSPLTQKNTTKPISS
jgi:predicted MFS family arabinose efflux permease